MANLDEAVKTQVRNIEQATGRSMDEWVTLVKTSEKERHTDILNWLKAEHGFSHGNANLVALMAKRGATESPGADLVDAMYSGAKATLRPFHDHVVERIQDFGADVELAPKKAYVSMRRSRQFATVGPGPRNRLEIGLNLKGVEPSGRLEAGSGMCTHRVRLSSIDELDASVVNWLHEAYDRA